MKSKYQKYYDTLKGKDYSGPVSKYGEALSTAKSKVDSAKSIIESSVWIEKGLEIIKSSVLPSFNEQASQIESGIGALSNAVGKVGDLVAKLEALDAVEKEYEACPDTIEVSNGKDLLGREKKEKKANPKKEELRQKVEEAEGAVDGAIGEINAITFEYSDKKPAFDTIMADLKESTSIEAKKKAFIGDVDDPSQYTEYTGNNLFGRHNELQLFDNTTGEIMQDHATITMKPGETRIITVKLPTDTGMINQITRTTADGNSAYRSGKILTARSDIDPDPNNIEWVRLVEGGYHAPSDMSLLHNNSYDWILTANAEGEVTASQTCLWSSSMTNGRNLKAMINLHVKVVGDNTTS